MQFPFAAVKRAISEEGYLITEAMWKYQPVVGTSVTGLRAQIIDGENGYVADDTAMCAQRTLNLIEDRDLWRKLGEQAHIHVRNIFLFPAMVLQYLGALMKARGISHTTYHA
jgi:trehalose synthase